MCSTTDAYRATFLYFRAELSCTGYVTEALSAGNACSTKMEDFIVHFIRVTVSAGTFLGANKSVSTFRYTLAFRRDSRRSRKMASRSSTSKRLEGNLRRTISAFEYVTRGGN